MLFIRILAFHQFSQASKFFVLKPLLMNLLLPMKTDASAWMKIACWLLCISTAGTFAVPPKDQVARQAIKFYPGKAARLGRSWLTGNCKHLVALLHQKNAVVKKLATAADAVGRDLALSEAERHFQVSG